MTSPLRRMTGHYHPPGHVDVLNLRELYPSSNLLEIPDVDVMGDVWLPSHWHAWPNRKKAGPADGIHCFTDDYRFEPLLRNPDRYTIRNTLISPDISLFPEMPLALQVYQVYRSRWIVNALRARGATVIPSVSWASPETYTVAFAGLPKGSPIGISAYGARRAGDAYRRGYEAMLAALEPSTVIVIGGRKPDWMTNVNHFTCLHVDRLENGRTRDKLGSE